MITKISDWLDKQGYPLEMKVAKLFREKGFIVRHSPYYLDQESKIRREIDIIASVLLVKENTGLKFTFVVECKNTIEKPWVSFCSKQHSLHPRAFIIQKCATKIAQKLLEEFSKKDIELNEGFIFKQPNRPAYNITQAFTSDNDKAYTAMYSAAKASWSLIKPNYDTINHNEIVIPMVVIGGKLFESFLDESGQFNVEEVKRSTIIWNNPLVGMPNTTIFIETFDALSDHIEVYKKEIKNFFKQCEDIFPILY